jgi:MMP 1-O-methyltransferase
MNSGKNMLTNEEITLIISDFDKIDGWMNVASAVELYRIASLLPEKAKIVEIGAYKGRGTSCLARGLQNGKVIVIDTFDSRATQPALEGQETLDEFLLNMQERNLLSKIKILCGPSSEFVKRIPKIDFLVIDGDHSITQCQYDYDNYACLIPVGGYIAFHDYYSDRPDLGPTWVIHNCIGKQYEFVGLYETLWIGKKIA